MVFLDCLIFCESKFRGDYTSEFWPLLLLLHFTVKDKQRKHHASKSRRFRFSCRQKSLTATCSFRACAHVVDGNEICEFPKFDCLSPLSCFVDTHNNVGVSVSVFFFFRLCNHQQGVAPTTTTIIHFDSLAELQQTRF